jgi:hypothetical protein
MDADKQEQQTEEKEVEKPVKRSYSKRIVKPTRQNALGGITVKKSVSIDFTIH